MTAPDPAANRPEARLQRTEEQLRNVVSMLAHLIWYRQTRPGDHVWSIPVDKERDFDCILTDAIDELMELRATVRALEERIRAVEQLPEKWLEMRTRGIEYADRYGSDDHNKSYELGKANGRGFCADDLGAVLRPPPHEPILLGEQP